LGILAAKIAARLKIDQKTVLKYSGNPRPVKSIRNLLEKGLSAAEIADKYTRPAWISGMCPAQRDLRLTWK